MKKLKAICLRLCRLQLNQFNPGSSSSHCWACHIPHLKMKNKNRLFILFVSVLSILLTTGCETTKRYSMKDRGSMFVDEKELNKQATEAWNELKWQVPRARKHSYRAALDRVSRNLVAKYPNPKNINWEFIVFECATPNAFCFPGGKIGIYSGLFEYIHNEAELALVVGHEMAHALCRHISEQQGTELFTGILGTAVQLTLEDKRYHKGYNAASHFGVTLPYSRSQEYEADYLGLKIATEAGYDPRGAIKFLEKLGKIPKSEQELEFFSTHPSAANRIKKLEDRFYEFQYIYDQLPKNTIPTAPAKTHTSKHKRIKESNQSIKDRYKNASPMVRYAVDKFLKGLDED